MRPETDCYPHLLLLVAAAAAAAAVVVVVVVDREKEREREREICNPVNGRVKRATDRQTDREKT